jgi:hypothetical protein
MHGSRTMRTAISLPRNYGTIAPVPPLLRAYSEAVSTHASDHSEARDLELPVEELLRRARPLPPHDQMVIEDLTEDEGVAFLEAVTS